MNPRGAVLLRLPRRSDREKPDPKPIGELTFQVERFADIATELPPLFARHWHDLADHQDSRPLDPDWERYLAMDASNKLKVLSARCGPILVGYIFNLIGPHLHYKSTLHAEIEMFWLEPTYRGGWFAVKWFRANDAMLREAGVKFIHCGIKNNYMAGRVGSIFRRLGYKPAETLWTD